MKIPLVYIFLLITSINETSKFDPYYNLVNLANRQLYHNNYNQAKSHLIEAFKLERSPYYHDIYKLILCNSKLNERKGNEALLELLFYKKNIHPKLIQHQLDGILSQKEIAFLEKLEYVESKSKLKTKLLELIEYDQKIRDYSKCESISDDTDKRKCMFSLFAIRDSIDELNAKRFIKLIKEYGIPSENEIGVYLDGLSSSYKQLFYIFGIHFIQTKYRNEIYDIYTKGLEEEKFHPELFAAVYDFMHDNLRSSSGKKMLSTSVSRVDNNLYKPFIIYTESNKDSINNNRINIGLDSFHVFQKQVLSDLICKKQEKSFQIISFPQFNEMPYGLVKAAFDKENIPLESYKFDTRIIKNECQCH